jgi:hypothetical protein
VSDGIAESQGARRPMKTISSRATLYFKLLPVFWSSGFGLGTIGLWLEAFGGKNNDPALHEMKYIFTAAWAVGTASLWSCVAFKRVRIDATHLYVSNYLEEISIPFTNVKDVTENRWINIHPVTIHLKNANEFGDRITFMPKSRFFGWTSHPVVRELKKLAHIDQ